MSTDNSDPSVQLPENVQANMRFLQQSEKADNLTADERRKEVETFHAIVRYALNADRRAKNQLITAFSNLSNLLFSYGLTSALQAVWENDPTWIQVGLVAMALEDLRMDWRETLVQLSLLGNSARKIAAPLDSMVENASTVAAPKCAELMRGYFKQSVADQAIELMGYREGTDEYGFMYIQLGYNEIP